MEHGRVKRRPRSLWCDATQRLGWLIHVDCSFLVVKNLDALKVVQYAKEPGSDNSAHVCTLGLNAELMTKHVSALDGRYSAGRPTLCPDVLKYAGFSRTVLYNLTVTVEFHNQLPRRGARKLT